MFRFRNRVGCTIALQNFRMIPLINSKFLLKFARNETKKVGKIHFNVIFFSIHKIHYNGFQRNYNALCFCAVNGFKFNFNPILLTELNVRIIYIDKKIDQIRSTLGSFDFCKKNDFFSLKFFFQILRFFFFVKLYVQLWFKIFQNKMSSKKFIPRSWNNFKYINFYRGFLK